ncbi:MAG: signal recognition particle-docking protein FtsY [Campylobacterales bacterium]|nr:signal recognition particle-docking protein FtsY [Campylobacterales bacterium]
MISFFKKGLSKTNDALKSIVPERAKFIDKDLLEEALVESDMNYELVEEILENMPNVVTKDELFDALLDIFNVEIKEDEHNHPNVDLIIGVNGAGKTTTIGKLANYYKQKNEKVMVAAGDTFRAAAIEQLKKWADRLDVSIVYTQQGHDSSAVAYDAIESAKAKKYDRVIIDTAGRLHTQQNLTKELEKIVRICTKAYDKAPSRKILILDGTQGTMALTQAMAFKENIGVDGIVITKLDGTAKGGAVFSVVKDLGLPLLFVGVGEREDDLVPFDGEGFVESFLEGIFS